MRQPAERFREHRAKRAVDFINNGSIVHDILVVLFSWRFWTFLGVLAGTILVITQ